MKRPFWHIAGLLLLLLVCGCNKKVEPPADVLQAYLSDWQQQNYSGMYDRLTPKAKSSISGEEFAQRYRKIYDGIEAEHLAISANPQETPQPAKDAAEWSSVFHVSMDTLAGALNFNYKAKLVKTGIDKETKWLIDWEPSLIFPQMAADDKVKIQTIKPERGEIWDRNGNGLAVNGSALQLGIVPGKLGELADTTKARLAEKLGIGTDAIQKKLNAAWVKPDSFVPLAFVADDAANEYRDMNGISFQKKPIRTYPYAEAAAHLTGYIAEINADELGKLKGQGYETGDLIGKSGMEQVFEERLRGKRGAVISVTDANGKEKTVLAELKAVPGTTVKLTIDAELQQIIFNEIKQDAATAAAIQPASGDVLALLSSPSYDPNAFERGLSGDQYNQWNNDPRQPFLNRFSKGFAPGSSFKIVTAAIGLDTKTVDPAEQRPITGLTWSKDRSWGNYFVKRVNESSPVDLLNALVYSDNIYFAQAALQVGSEAFIREAARFGIGEKVPIPFPVSKSQLYNTGIKNDIQLADTGYGQGEVTMTSLHVAHVFSSLVNDGNMVYPTLLEEDKANHPSTWKNTMTPETAAILKNDLVQAVSSPKGAGHGAYIAGASIAGKTGTAELKQSKDADGRENGWFVGFNAADPQLLVSVMIEDVKGRGGSGYVTPKVKHVFQQTIKK
ncbi:penicillin-binding transpeptidase domain-containing protein [Paenibacillus piri]|uniref:Penicillin-binding transpeptidase domain-containing protein n=1 Tax=Paenibacillus piri TaxID=2547395 RepID=A0A4R5KNT8_9BACL|nr:penicillin-binding transpeptidase domain-containing protein [Paenibacillus piri]TDF96270.1 penicillin-binding transpeptidase domain-containing protein [Paenibacillus piri]